MYHHFQERGQTWMWCRLQSKCERCMVVDGDVRWALQEAAKAEQTRLSEKDEKDGEERCRNGMSGDRLSTHRLLVRMARNSRNS